MIETLHQKVLVLNKAWLPIGDCTVKKALEDMNSSKQPKSAIHIEYEKTGEDEWDFNNPIIHGPLDWDKWIMLSPREFDRGGIGTPNMLVRIPTVIIVGSSYNKLPRKTFRPTKRNIYEQYKGKDFWTGEDLSFKDCTLDHVIPSSKGGKNTWHNLAPTAGKVNRLKDDMDPEEFQAKHGYKPHYKLKEPAPVTAQVMIKALCPDWAIFLHL